jgi:putative intracellular protease/amidase
LHFTKKTKQLYMKILIVLTSHSKLGRSEEKTGFWIEEFAAPYYLFKEAGAKITLASPKGGQPPIDPKSDAPDNQTEATVRYKKDDVVLGLMANTTKLEKIDSKNFDAIFFPGGHGPLWDLTSDHDSISLIEEFWDAKKPVAAVCHAPAVLLNVKDEDGNYIVKGKKITGFSNTEEAAIDLDHIVPFMLEDELIKKGAIYSKKEDWTSYAIKDGLLITGQNAQSSEAVAKKLLGILSNKTVLI